MQTKCVVKRLPLTKALLNLGALVRRVHNNKEQFILERNGNPVAALIDMDEYEDYLYAQDPGLTRQIRQGYREYQEGKLREELDAFLSKLKSKSKYRTSS